MKPDKRLLSLVRQDFIPLLLTIALGTVAGVLAVFQAQALSRVVTGSFLDGLALAQLGRPMAALLALIAGRAGVAWASELSAHAAAQRIKTHLRRRLYRHLIALGPAFTRGESTGELANTVVDGIEALDATFSQYLPQLALAAIVPLTILAFITPLDLLSALVLLLTAPLIPLFMVLIGNAAQALTHQQWQSMSRMSAYFLDVLQGLTTLKTLGRSRQQAEVLADVSERFRVTTMSVLRVAFLSALVLEMTATISTAVVAVEIGLRLLYGRLGFEQALFILILAPEFYLPLRLLGTRFHAGITGNAAAKRIFAVLEQATGEEPIPESYLQAAANQENNDLTQLEKETPQDIVFEDVHYTYPDGRPALNGVSFRIPAGQTIALVGPSGAGKTTIASLLLGFIVPTRGRILYGGRELQTMSGDEWRARLAWVPQNPYLFEGSIAENIALGRPEASFEEVVQAASYSYAQLFIQDLPQGYNTLTGERGARLSGGQAQRIALARAFLKDAPIMILDEPSASLDPELETLLRQSTAHLLQNRSALIIAHRLNTVTQADRILVLSEGHIVESGTHQQLLSQDGLYKQLLAAGSLMSAPPSLEHGVLPQDNLLQVETLARPALDLQPVVSPDPVQPEAAPAAGSSRSSSWSVFLRLLGFLAAHKGGVLLSVLLGFATIGSSLGLMWAGAYLISAAALQPSIAALQVAIVGVRFFGITRGVGRYLERYVSHEVTFRVLARLRVWFYSALEPLAPARLLEARSGDLQARILGDIGSLESFFVRAVAPPLVAFLTAVAAGALLARFSIQLALALEAFMLLACVGLPLLALVMGRAAGKRLVAARARLTTAVIDGLQGLADLLAFGAQDRQAGEVEASGQALAKAQTSLAWAGSLQAGLQTLLANLAAWTLLSLAIPMVSAGAFEPVYLAAIVLASLASFEAAQPLPLAAQLLEANLQSARRLFEVVACEPEVTEPLQPAAPPAPAVPLSVVMEKLSFYYPAPSPGKSPALEDLSLTLSKGRRVAVTGPSGAGKSTLAHLLLRFWEPTSGQIWVNGSDIGQLSSEDWRRQIAVIEQNTYLFNASIYDNLHIARPDAGQDEVIRAARTAQIHDFIESLPEGYQTWIGEWGLRLSAGQRQRLAIARALLRDAPILIMDEPTSSLDTITEQAVLQSLVPLMEGRVVLWITHRLVGLEGMDEILVLATGKVVERGTHVQLLQFNGMYQRMWELQHGAFIG